MSVGRPPAQNVRSFFAFINERHAIYLRRKDGQAWPWTEDPWLRDYKFCQVFRELDTVTIWIREHWREPYADHPNLWFAMAVARQINWPPTLEAIGFPDFDPGTREASRWFARAKSKMLQMQKRGEKIYTGAYMLTGMLGGSKIDQTLYKILEPLSLGIGRNGEGGYRGEPLVNSSLEHAWSQLLPFAGFAGFLAYEVVSDWRHTRYLRKADDIKTWANPGPGAIRGLCRLWGTPLKENRHGRLKPPPYDKQLALDQMRWLLEQSPKHLKSHVPALEMRDIEHCLCETDKYERVKNGQGVLERYKPPTGLL